MLNQVNNGVIAVTGLEDTTVVWLKYLFVWPLFLWITESALSCLCSFSNDLFDTYQGPFHKTLFCLIMTLPPQLNPSLIFLSESYMEGGKNLNPLVMCKLFKFSSLSNPLKLRWDHLPSRQSRPWGNNKDPTVWLDGARPPPRYVFRNDMILRNSKI